MKCPECGGQHIHKNGHRRGKQNHICVTCGRQFLSTYSERGHSDWTKRLCLRMYVNGMGFQGIERLIGVAHTTVIHWVQQVGALFPDAYNPDDIPKVGE